MPRDYDGKGAPCAEHVHDSYGPFAPKGEPKDVSLRGTAEAGPGPSKGMTHFGKTLETTRHDQTTRSTVNDPFMQSREAEITAKTKPGKQRPA